MTTRTVPRAEVLGLPVDVLSLDQAVALCEEFATGPSLAAGARGESPAGNGCSVVVTLNVEMTMSARNDPVLRDAIVSADLVVPDSVGIVWAARLGRPVPGIELIEALAEAGAARGASFFLLGGAPGVADDAAQALSRRFPGIKIVGTRHGYFKPDEESAILRDVGRSKPDYLLVALGAGRQEAWIHRLRAQVDAAVAMGVGGSFDVISGRKKRAPTWARKLRLEWLHRITTQPSRLGRALALPRFAAAVIAGRLRGRSGPDKSKPASS